jgi:hypothetical protein
LPEDILQHIQWCFANDKVVYSSHARRNMNKEPLGIIYENEVYQAVTKSEIIKSYPEDKPYLSVLLYGNTSQNRPIHIVVAFDFNEKISIIVTVYEPDPDLWIDFKRRTK